MNNLLALQLVFTKTSSTQPSARIEDMPIEGIFYMFGVPVLIIIILIIICAIFNKKYPATKGSSPKRRKRYNRVSVK
jgi:hypothetical protein